MLEGLAQIFAPLASLFLHHDYCVASVLKVFRLDWLYCRHFSLAFVVLLPLLICYKLAQLFNFERAFVFFPSENLLILSVFALEKRLLLYFRIDEPYGSEVIWLYFQHPSDRFLIGRFYDNNFFALNLSYFLKNFLCFRMELLFFLVSIKQQYFSTISRHLQLPHFVLKIHFCVKPIDIKMCHFANLFIVSKIVPFLCHFNFELGTLKLKT